MTPSLSITVDDDGRVALEPSMETHVDPSLMAAAFASLAHDWRPVLPRRALPAGEGRWTCTRARDRLVLCTAADHEPSRLLSEVL